MGELTAKGDRELDRGVGDGTPTVRRGISTRLHSDGLSAEDRRTLRALLSGLKNIVHDDALFPSILSFSR